VPPIPEHLTDDDLLAALRAIPEQYQQVIVLCDVEEMTYKEIAEALDIPMGTVMSTLSRARVRFRHAAGELLKTDLSSESDSPGVEGRECVGAGAWD
jgi:RNA polymerase sigma-70 factor (ECF subfamily)